MSEGQQLENKDLAYYCKRFAELNVRTNLKPILLLSVIDLILRGSITTNQITVSNDLIETFNKYWDRLDSGSSKRGLHYPFIHLEGDGFWHIKFTPEVKLGRKIGSEKALKESVEYARLDEELFDLLIDPISQIELIDTLIAAWFSSKRDKIEDILQVNQDFEQISQNEIQALEETDNLDKQPKIILRKSLIRNAFFRKAVVYLYDYRCAFCRLKVMRAMTQNIVDGAHIKPFAKFFDSRANNGISLCKNHHWAFDQGWFTIDDNYKIIVASDLEEDSPNGKTMKDFQGEIILLPNSEQNLPRLDALQWHRLNVFKA